MRKMKDSGIAWIGEIPEGWKTAPIGTHYEYRNEKVSDYEYAPLSVTKLGIVPQLEDAAKTDAHDSRKKVCVDDFVINSRSDRKQSCGLSSLQGSVSLINTVLIHKGEIIPKYSAYLLNNYAFAEELYRWGTGIVADLWSTKWELMKRITVPIPSKTEQKQIADFLDKKCAEIDKLIELQESMIEKLKEYKQSVITQAVTKGLDPDVPMKDSGIEWIGKIPEGWAIIPLKYCCKANQRVLSEKTDDNLLLEYIDIASVDDCGNINNVQLLEFKDAPSRARRIVKTNDIIISTVRTYLKAIARITDDYDNDICSTGFAVLTPNKIKEGYLYYALFSNIFTSRVEMYSNGISYPAINTSSLIALSIAVPNSNEQQQIADYLDKKCAEIDDLIKLKEQKIEKLKEYKKSLIYEYVTGKKEVC